MKKQLASFSFISKIRFYAALAYYNIVAPLECQNLQLKVLVNEIRYLLAALNGFKLQFGNTNRILLKTRFGNFHIRDTCWDIIVAAPSFERLDINRLLSRMSAELTKGKRVIFLDIGAQFGKYTVTVGSQFKKHTKKLSIYAFEPDPGNFELLRKNVSLNELENVKLFSVALSDKKAKKHFFYYEPQKMVVSFPTSKKIVVPTERIDEILGGISDIRDTTVFIKIDIEGHEIAALQGGKKLWAKSRKNILLIEDAISPYSNKLIRYLQANGSFIEKITTYNSFWRLTS